MFKSTLEQRDQLKHVFTEQVLGLTPKYWIDYNEPLTLLNNETTDHCVTGFAHSTDNSVTEAIISYLLTLTQ